MQGSPQNIKLNQRLTLCATNLWPLLFLAAACRGPEPTKVPAIEPAIHKAAARNSRFRDLLLINDLEDYELALSSGLISTQSSDGAEEITLHPGSSASLLLDIYSEASHAAHLWRAERLDSILSEAGGEASSSWREILKPDARIALAERVARESLSRLSFLGLDAQTADQPREAGLKSYRIDFKCASSVDVVHVYRVADGSQHHAKVGCGGSIMCIPARYAFDGYDASGKCVCQRTRLISSSSTIDMCRNAGGGQ